MNEQKLPLAPTDQHTPICSGEYLDKSQLARRLGISIRSVDNLVRSKRVPFVRLTGKLIRFPWSEVKQHLDRTCRVNARGEERGGSR